MPSHSVTRQVQVSTFPHLHLEGVSAYDLAARTTSTTSRHARERRWLVELNHRQCFNARRHASSDVRRDNLPASQVAGTDPTESARSFRLILPHKLSPTPLDLNPVCRCMLFGVFDSHYRSVSAPGCVFHAPVAASLRMLAQQTEKGQATSSLVPKRLIRTLAVTASC